MNSDLRVSATCLDEKDEAELTWRVIAPAYNALSLYDGADTVTQVLERLTLGQRALLAIHWCISETLNGGFDQFFTNSSGLLTDEVLIGFVRIGVPQAAAIVQAARQILPSRPPDADTEAPDFDEADEADRFDAYLAQYEPLQDEFQTLIAGDLYAHAAAYVHLHPEEFIQ